METINVRKGAKVFKEAMKVDHTMAWSEFEPLLKKKFESFLLHHIAKRVQFKARDKLYNKQGDNILMQPGDLFVSIDYMKLTIALARFILFAPSLRSVSSFSITTSLRSVVIDHLVHYNVLVITVRIVIYDPNPGEMVQLYFITLSFGWAFTL